VFVWKVSRLPRDRNKMNFTVSTYSGCAGDQTELNQTVIAHTPVV
jgi:hypothetical protein